MLTAIQYRILKRIAPGERHPPNVYDAHRLSKLQVLLGTDVLRLFKDKSVLDYGCGEGAEAVELARSGAARVMGLDVQPAMLEKARQLTEEAGVAQVCHFSHQPDDERFDFVVSLDAFEHFADPAAVLKQMEAQLKPGGRVLVSFGPTWFHPLGGHLLSVFPWAHLVFSEEALLRWRADFRSDGARRFGEVDGGLNQMTIGRFIRLVEDSPLEFDRLELVPIRALRRVHNRLSREFTTAVVRCDLIPRHDELA